MFDREHLRWLALAAYVIFGVSAIAGAYVIGCLGGGLLALAFVALFTFISIVSGM